jgi:transcriptional regulator with XRE-family HTH domain
VGLNRNLNMLLGLHDLNAGDFAGRMGMSSTSVSYWLNGHREPSAENLIQIAEFFQVPATALMRDKPEDFIRFAGDPDRFAKVEHEIFWQGREDEPPTPIKSGKKKTAARRRA